MTTDTEILEVVGELQKSGKTIAEFLGVLYKDKLLEIYLGDSYEEVSVEQISVAYPAVICGKVIGAYRECLILNCAYVEKNKFDNKMKMGNYVFVNERSIRFLNEIDGKGILEDMFLRSRESLTVKKYFEPNE